MRTRSAAYFLSTRAISPKASAASVRKTKMRRYAACAGCLGVPEPWRARISTPRVNPGDIDQRESGSLFPRSGPLQAPNFRTVELRVKCDTRLMADRPTEISGDHVRVEESGKLPCVRNVTVSDRRTVSSGIVYQCSWHRPTTDLCRPFFCLCWRGFGWDFLRESLAKIYGNGDTVDQHSENRDISATGSRRRNVHADFGRGGKPGGVAEVG